MLIQQINLKKFLDFTPEKYDREELKYIHFEYNKEKKELEIVATDSYILIRETCVLENDTEEEDFKMNISVEDFKKLVAMKIDFLEIDIKNKTLNNLNIDFNGNIPYAEYSKVFESLEEETKEKYNKISQDYNIQLLNRISKALKGKGIDENCYKITMRTEEKPILLENTMIRNKTISILAMPIRL